MSKLFTIGYANKDLENFKSLLIENKINCIVDVRTSPFSKQFPMYNEYGLKKFLNENDIFYLSFKDEFGARRSENEVYSKIEYYDGSFIDYVDFQKVYNLDIFKNGVSRIKHGIDKGFNIAFMCSEKHPIDCHRAIMVSEYFYQNNFEIEHIISNTEKQNHKDLDLALEENFNLAKKRFERKYKNDLSELNFAGSLLDTNTKPNEFIQYWYDFFKNYNRIKGIKLRNMDIGYKRGTDEND